MKLSLFLGFFISLLPLSIQAASPVMKFVVPQFPPYTYQDNNEIKGIAVDAVKKILAHAKISYEIELTTDYDRAIYETTKGSADGFFIASQNNIRDEVAVFSKTILLNSWSWFALKNTKYQLLSDDFKKNAMIGTVLNTNTHKWLIKERYLVSTAVLNIELLINMLNKHHVDAIFVAKSVFEQGVRRGNKPMDNYLQIDQVIKPMGIYLSKKYLAKNPGVLEKINQAILHFHGDIN